MNNISMPKCCSSCDHYKHIGRYADSHNPCVNQWGERSPTSRFGKCNLNRRMVYFYQKCARFKADYELVDIVDVTPPNNVLEPIQGELL